MKLWHVQCGMSAIVTRYAVSSLETMLTRTKFWIWNGSYSNHIVTVHEYGAPRLQHIVLQTWKLDGHPSLVAHGSLSEGLGALQLWKAYGKERELPSTAIGTQHFRE